MRLNGKQAVCLPIVLIVVLPLAANCFLASEFSTAAAEPASADKATEPEKKRPSPPDKSARDKQLAEYSRVMRSLAIKPGDQAPEWFVDGWTDGQQRTLKSLRGKVVVLKFWGVWCGPCLQGLPFVEELQRKYRDQDVVFLGIHSAGTSMDEIKKSLEKHGSTLVTGQDAGPKLEEGGTVKAYRPFGWPTTVVIGADGIVTWTSGEFTGDREAVLQEMHRLAMKAGLPWPIDKGADTEEEKKRRNLAYDMVMFSEPIDAALAKMKQE